MALGVSLQHAVEVASLRIDPGVDLGELSARARGCSRARGDGGRLLAREAAPVRLASSFGLAQLEPCLAQQRAGLRHARKEVLPFLWSQAGIADFELLEAVFRLLKLLFIHRDLLVDELLR